MVGYQSEEQWGDSGGAAPEQTRPDVLPIRGVPSQRENWQSAVHSKERGRSPCEEEARLCLVSSDKLLPAIK